MLVNPLPQNQLVVPMLTNICHFTGAMEPYNLLSFCQAQDTMLARRDNIGPSQAAQEVGKTPNLGGSMEDFHPYVGRRLRLKPCCSVFQEGAPLSLLVDSVPRHSLLTVLSPLRVPLIQSFYCRRPGAGGVC